jgi:glutamate--cysteine ligase
LYSGTQQRLERLQQADGCASLRGGLVGLEKECLRVGPDGTIAQTPHPRALGSALTNTSITTDYSEALLEIITPPMRDRQAVLSYLRHAHKFVYDRLGEELLWSASMPCVLAGSENIPIAQYGSSNAGLMKTVYRRGLGHRYGRSMQVIAGVHFNYSVPQDFWPLYRRLENDGRPLQDFVSETYMGMIRNLQRLGWLIPYLFGASPAVCKSFVDDQVTELESFNGSTFFYPYATSLRMGDIGYQNSLEEGRGFKANYDSLDAYVRSLTWAMETSCPENEAIGVLRDGEYQQLSANVLQIENEHYSTIRPKQPPRWMEKPSLALRRRGVAYVELRSVDVNAFDPLGVTEPQLYFLEAFLLFCMLSDSPRISATEGKIIDRNQILAAHRGRDPGLRLGTQAGDKELRGWARDILQAMVPLAEALDGDDPQRPYSATLQRQSALVDDPHSTPSARMLAEMSERGEGFFAFAERMSKSHRDTFERFQGDADMLRRLELEAADSLRKQLALETAEQVPFERFLADYFHQS